MKRAVPFMYAAIVILVVIAAACTTDAQNKKLTVAIDASYPPFEQLNAATGQPEGFSVDLMNAVAARAGLDFEWVNVGFDRVLSGVAACQYDMACSSISITEERQKMMLFSDPISTGGQVVVVRKENTDINGAGDLAGKTVAVETPSTAADAAGKISGVNLKTYDGITQVFQAVMDGQCDAAVADNIVSAYFTAKYPDKLKVVGAALTEEKDGIAVCKKNAYLLPEINAALKSLKDDGTIDKLRSKWLIGH